MESRGRTMVKEALRRIDWDGNPNEFFLEEMETNDEYIPSFEASSSDSSEVEQNASQRNYCQIQKVNICNANKNTTQAQCITPKKLVFYDDTSDDDSNLESNTITTDNGTYIEVSEVNNTTPIVNDIPNSIHQIRMKRKSFPSRDNTSKKRKRAPHTWKKNKAALLREKGESYKSYSGKDIAKKLPNLGMLCNEKCPFHCNLKFSKEQREKIFVDFYKLDVNSKNALLYNCISMIKVNTQSSRTIRHKSMSFVYMVKNECQTFRVCKTALANIFNIGRGKIDHIQKFIKSGDSVPPPDRRGKHMNRPHRIDSEVLDYIKDHIRSFPCEESHYSRNKNIHKKYLSPLLSQRKMYELYLELVSENEKPEKFKVAECTYRKLFSSKFNLSFGHPRSDTCSTCDLGEVSEIHVESYKQAFEMQKFDKEFAKQRSEVAYITLDLQQTMPLPKLSVSKAFYLRQLWFYNLGVHIVIDSKEAPHFLTWTEDVACRGSNEIASSLLTLIEFDDSLKSKDHLIIWTDSCSGQNKNSTMLFLYQYLILKGYFKVIEHKFPEVGHSYLDSDRDFGRIEKQLRKHETVFLPDHYRDIIRQSGKNHCVTDMTPHFRNFHDIQYKLKLINRKRNVLNEKVAFRDQVKWIRVEEFGSYLYKDCHDPNTPFKKVELFKKNRKAETSNVEAIEFERMCYNDNGAKLTIEKIKNLESQLPYIKNEYRFYYESVIQKVKERQ